MDMKQEMMDMKIILKEGEEQEYNLGQKPFQQYLEQLKKKSGNKVVNGANINIGIWGMLGLVLSPE